MFKILIKTINSKNVFRVIKFNIVKHFKRRLCSKIVFWFIKQNKINVEKKLFFLAKYLNIITKEDKRFQTIQ